MSDPNVLVNVDILDFFVFYKFAKSASNHNKNWLKYFQKMFHSGWWWQQQFIHFIDKTIQNKSNVTFQQAMPCLNGLCPVIRNWTLWFLLIDFQVYSVLVTKSILNCGKRQFRYQIGPVKNSQIDFILMELTFIAWNQTGPLCSFHVACSH